MAKPFKAKSTKKRKGSTPTTGLHPETYHLYTDGSFRPPHAASLAYLVFSERTKHIVALGREAHKGMTINQMELMAILRAISFSTMSRVIIYTDSAYCIGALTTWCKTWAANDWITPSNQPVKNKEIIQEILAKMATKQSVSFVKIAAHTGDPFNSMVDWLAQDLTFKMQRQAIPDGPYDIPHTTH